MPRAQMKYHERIGFTYMPQSRSRVSDAVGDYLVRTNGQGFRSDRDFEPARRVGIRRILLFGDSQTAGDGVANPLRYSDRLEAMVPGIEIYNYGLSGTGPDQHLLAFEEYAVAERDLVVIGLHVENIRRVRRGIVKSRDASGEVAYYAKPYFERDGDELVLRHVPVPKRGWTEATLPAEYRSQVYDYTETNFRSRTTDRPSRAARITRAGPLGPLRRVARDAAMRATRFQPLPEYDRPDDPGWLLLSRILESWIDAIDEPVLLVTIPHVAYLVDSSDGSRCRARFEELAAATGCRLYDPLPDLLARPAAARREMCTAGHLSAHGHEVLAELLAPVIAEVLDSTDTPAANDAAR